jgi:hypothetical protein
VPRASTPASASSQRRAVWRAAGAAPRAAPKSRRASPTRRCRLRPRPRSSVADRDHYVGHLDHGAHIAALGDAEIADRLERDRGGDPLAAGADLASPWQMRTTFAGTRLQALSIIFVRSFSACVVGRKQSAGHRRSARDPIGGIAAVNRDLDSYERAVLRLVPEELYERVRRHLYEARVRPSALLMADMYEVARAATCLTSGSRSQPGHRCDDPYPTRVGYRDGMSRSRTDKHVTQPSSFSNSEMSTRTGV